MHWVYIIYREILSILQQGGVVFVGILIVGVWMYHIILTTWFALQPIEGDLAKLEGGAQPGPDAVQRKYEVFKLQSLSWIDRRLPVIAVMVGICTLAGLLGTVSGMLVTFSSMSNSDGIKPMEKIAAGISEAMVTTQAGLLIALPAVFAFAMLRLRVRRVHAQVEQSLAREIRRCQWKGGQGA